MSCTPPFGRQAPGLDSRTFLRALPGTPAFMHTLPTALLLLCLSSLNPTHAAWLSGRIVGVSDGDTVKILDATRTTHTIRLLGIDAPEKAQPFGARSKQSLSDLAFGQTINVDWQKRDRYGRIVGKLLDRRGKDLNLAQIERGMAWHYADYQREQSRADREAYARAESEARHKRLGLWADRDPEAPWEYRRDRRTARTAAGH